MKAPTTCFAGRIIIRDDPAGGLDWSRPCPVPSEFELPTKPPMWFCVQHYDAAAEMVWLVMDHSAARDRGIAAQPPDAFDLIVDRLRE